MGPVESTDLYSQRKTVLKGHIVVVAGLEIVCSIKFYREDRSVDNVVELNVTEERSVGRINGVRVSSSSLQGVSQFLRFWKLRRDQSGWSETLVGVNHSYQD